MENAESIEPNPFDLQKVFKINKTSYYSANIETTGELVRFLTRECCLDNYENCAELLR